MVSGETLLFMQRLWSLAHGLEVRSKRMARTIGVTGPQRLVIRIVGQRSLLTARELAGTLGIHPSTLTGILRRLEDQDLIERRLDAADRRRSRFQLTARGRRVDRERKGTVEAAVRRALGRADRSTIAQTAWLLELLATELSRADDSP
ncbi:MAG: MarR family winged helix-turn-helix transcriptional regulator [Kofleriaceae bacterium]